MLEIYEKIFLIRTIESKLDQLFKQGLVHGTAHFCIGQEFIPAIISNYLTKEDVVTSTHRGHGHAISKGLNPKKFLAELMGKQIGYNRGKAGSQHVVSPEFNYYANGVTGGMVSIAAGMAFANKYFENNNIVVAFFGDGAFNEGNVQESLNLAKIFNLPIMFVCENNQYAMSTPRKKSHASEIFERANAYGMLCGCVDNNDYKKLDAFSKKFIQEIREGKGPAFLEIRTYRHGGHSKNDQNLYREKDEEIFWLEKDVLVQLEKDILSSGVSLEKIDKIKKEITMRIDAIVAELVSESDSDVSSIQNFVYKE